MTIGNALFSQLSISRFNRIDGDLAALQTRIASGTNDPRVSADTVRAAQLSAARDHQMRLESYMANAATVSGRLSLTDSTLGALSDGLRELRQIALEAANTATASTARSIHANQVSELRDSLVALGNTRDSGGFPLFSGLSGATPFTIGPDGVSYTGDTGQTQVQLSESRRMDIGVNGASILMAVPSEGGRHSVFDMIDDLLSGLTTLADSVAQTTVNGTARLVPSQEDLALTLRGPSGEAQVHADPATAQGLSDAINAQSSLTGISARPDPDSSGVLLSAAGDIAVSGLVSRQNDDVLAVLTPLQGSDPPVRMRPAHMAQDAILGRLSDAVSHLAEQRGHVGALAGEVDGLSDRLAARKVIVDKAVAGLNDLDLAAASTRLAALMTQQQAAMQTYSMITRKTLFDFIG